MLVIAIVKSSLALSLGLVGALSIVRFRSAIKEPEELVYLFLSIAIGLGLGADQRTLTITAFFVIISIVMIKHLRVIKEDTQNLYITITSNNSDDNIKLEEIVALLKTHCMGIKLIRFDENKNHLEALFMIDIESFTQISTLKSDLRSISDSINITFLDNNGVI